MVPLSRLIRHEWTLHARSGVLRIVLVAFVLLTGTTMWIGATDVARARSSTQVLVSATHGAGDERGVDYLANQSGALAVLPTGPLQALSVGQSDVYASHLRITARLADAQLSGDQLNHPIVLQSGRLDLSSVVLFLYALLIVGLSYDLLASDRDSGTLRLVLVQGGTLKRFVAGKLVARLILVVAVPVIAAVVTYFFTPSSQPVRLIFWIASAVSYGVFWLGLAVYVNARGGNAVGNALTLAGLWLTLAIVVPSLVNVAARVMFPVPSRVQLDVAMREAARDAVAEGSRTLGRFLEDHPSTGTGEEGMKLYYSLQEARDRQIAESVRPLMQTFQTQRERQARAIGLLQFASPTILTQMLLTDIAGTSGHRAQRFADQAARFQTRWKAHFSPDVLVSNTTATKPPEFSYEEEPLADVLKRTLIPLLVLGAAGAWLLWRGVRRFTRYDITGAA